MNAASLELMFLRQGEKPTAAHLQALAQEIRRQTVIPGIGVRTRSFYFGTIHNYYGQGGGGGYVSDVFEPDVTSTGSAFQVRWKKGLIGGIEPMIEDTVISDKTRPALTVTGEHFNAEGEALVYFQLQIKSDWTLEKVVPIASREYLPDEAWRHHVLALIVYNDGGHWRKLHTSMRWLAANRRNNGRALHIVWPAFA